MLTQFKELLTYVTICYFLAKEWESLYQPEPLLQQMENVKLKEAAVIQKRKERKKIFCM